jgi:hypothetical protein
MKYWEIIADNLKKRGLESGWVSAIADAHRGDGQRFGIARFVLDSACQRAY